jgi:hypothetical protein
MRQAGLLLQIGFTCFLTIKKPRLFSGAAKVGKMGDLAKAGGRLLGYWLLAVDHRMINSYGMSSNVSVPVA